MADRVISDYSEKNPVASGDKILIEAANGSQYNYLDVDNVIAHRTTTNLSEGTNLYYTDARFDTRLATKDTDDITEGSNLYYTTARFNSQFDVRHPTEFDNRLATKTTSDLNEDQTSGAGVYLKRRYGTITHAQFLSIGSTPHLLWTASSGTHTNFIGAYFYLDNQGAAGYTLNHDITLEDTNHNVYMSGDGTLLNTSSSVQIGFVKPGSTTEGTVQSSWQISTVGNNNPTGGSTNNVLKYVIYYQEITWGSI
jgi:hypothetical protein